MDWDSAIQRELYRLKTEVRKLEEEAGCQKKELEKKEDESKKSNKKGGGESRVVEKAITAEGDRSRICKESLV